MDKQNMYSMIRVVLLVVFIVVALGALIWVASLSGKLSSVEQKTSSAQTAVASLTTRVASLTASITKLKSSNVTRLSSQISVNLPTLQSTYISLQSVTYPLLLTNAPESLSSSLSLTTITATNLDSLKPILSTTGTYEITQVNNLYYFAYPGSGLTYSIQILSSPYPDRVLSLVKALRSAGVPAFKIDYASQSGLFIGVFPDYNSASNYANAISTPNITSITGSGASSWLVRTIP
jgi:flagellar basal body-associated protein FliL